MKTKTQKRSKEAAAVAQPGAIRILLADDHVVLRDGLRSLLERQPDMELVGEVGDGRAAVEATQSLKPDIVLMDIGMPGLNGIDATRQILKNSSKTRVICLSMHRDQNLVQAMLKAGASGYLLKTSAAAELVLAIREVMAGHAHLTPAVAGSVVADFVRDAEGEGRGPFASLTVREREVLQLIAEGLHTKLIADRLQISAKTVFAHRESMMRKLGVDSVASLVRYALRENLTQL